MWSSLWVYGIDIKWLGYHKCHSHGFTGGFSSTREEYLQCNDVRQLFFSHPNRILAAVFGSYPDRNPGKD